MILTDHARKRLGQRFPGLEGVALLEQWEQAQGKKPTVEQWRLIQRYSKRPVAEQRTRLVVGPCGIVFVTDCDTIITVFRMPAVPPVMTDAQRRRHRLRRLRIETAPRRQKERPWEREYPDAR